MAADAIHPAKTSTASPEAKYVVASIIVFWICFYLLSTLRAWILDFDALTDAAGRRLLVVLTGMALFTLQWGALHLIRQGHFVRTIAAGTIIALPASIAYAWVNWLVFYAFQPTAASRSYIERWGAEQVMLYSTIDAAFTWYFFFAGWTLSYAALLAIARTRAAHHAAARAAQASHEAEMRALRYQLNPHFLFNTLNLLAALIMDDRKDEADQTIVDLADMLRMMLDERHSDSVALSQELEWQKIYLGLEARRFEGRLNVEYRCDDAVRNELVPLLITQPLAENSIKHGLLTSGAMTVSIKAERQGSEVVISFANDMDESGNAKSTSGYGIGHANIKERLNLFYGPAATFVTTKAPGRFEAIIRFPAAKVNSASGMELR